MTEHSGNQIIHNQDVTTGDYPGIELVKEYRDETKPVYDWNTKENLIVCLQFSKCLHFPESLFQNFIVERQGDAFWEEKGVEVKEEMDLVVSSESEQDSDEENLLEEFFRDDKSRSYESEKQLFELKRYIWSSGLYIQRKDENNQIFQIEIEKNTAEQQVIVRCSGKSTAARDSFDTFVQWFKNHTSSMNVLVICTCSLCQQKGLHHSHSIKYEQLENLSKRFEPKVQCYSSGAMQRLDFISTVKRPSFKTVIINSPADDDYCSQAKRHLFKSDSPIISVPIDRHTPFPGDHEEEYQRKVLNTDIAIILVSSHLTGGEDKLDIKTRQFAKLAIGRLEAKKIMVFVIIVSAIHDWEQHDLFDNVELIILNSEPIPFEKQKADESWSKIAIEFQKRISSCLKTLAEINN